jgi:hypothetical protein
MLLTIIVLEKINELNKIKKLSQFSKLLILGRIQRFKMSKELLLNENIILIKFSIFLAHTFSDFL